MLTFAAAAFVPPWLTTWLTPVWLLGMGAVAGLVILLLLWGLTALVARRFAYAVPSLVGEGVLLPLLLVIGSLAAFGIVATITVPEPVAMLESVWRLPYGGERTVEVVVPAGSETDGQPSAPYAVDVAFRGDELQRLHLEASQYVLINDGPTPQEAHGAPVEVDPVDGYRWQRSSRGADPFGGEFVPRFYITNLANTETTVKITLETAPAYPEARLVPFTALGVVALVLIYLIQASVFRRTSAVALATTKSEIAQPLFSILILLGAFLIVLFLFLPYNTFGEDIKMLKDSGLTLIMVFAIIQGVWAASNSVADEIEGRTALTVLSKPIGRRRFIIGKFLGILWTVALLFVMLGLLFLIVIAYKPVYDARELGADTPDWSVAFLEMVRTVPGLVLAFFETVVLVALSVAISTRLPMLANFVICFAIYVLGHLTPLIVQSPIQFPPVVFIGRLIATILPVLDNFNIQAAIAAGVEVPLSYVLMAFVYCVLYSAIALLLALALFQDRDLA